MRESMILIIILVVLFTPQRSKAFRCGTSELIENADAITPLQEPAATAPAPLLAIGTERTFFAPDFRSRQSYTVRAVLRGVGKYCYVYVEESEWDARVTPDTVTNIVRAFDERTPTQSRGIYPTLTHVFGAPPDIDANGRIILLLLNIRDAFENSGTYTAGFFNPADQQRGFLRHPGARGLSIRSNVADMLYIDTRPLPIHSPHAHNVIAHELQHLIHWRHDAREAVWVDEGCSDYAAFLCGYFSEEHVAAFEKTPTVSLTHWPENHNVSLAHYGAAFLWMLYLHEHYGGPDTVAAIVKHPSTDIDGITAVLLELGFLDGTQPRLPWHRTETIELAKNEILSVTDIFVDWQVANLLSGYKLIRRLTLTPTDMHRDYPFYGESVIPPFAAEFLHFALPNRNETLTLRFSGGNPAVADWAVHLVEWHSNTRIHIREMSLKTNRDTGNLNISPAATAALLIPSLQPEAARLAPINSVPYQYSATRGGNVTFITSVLPNPVHPQYWEIIAQTNEPLIGFTPTITLEYLERQTLVEEAPMRQLPRSGSYRYTVRLAPEQVPADVTWYLFLDARRVEQGTFSDIPK